MTPLLSAIHDIQQFQLIRFVAEDHSVQLTDEGMRTATAIKGNGIRSSAARLLED